MLVVAIAVIGRYLTKNKTTVAICDSDFNPNRSLEIYSIPFSNEPLENANYI